MPRLPVMSELSKVEPIIKNDKMGEKYKNWQRRFEMIRDNNCLLYTSLTADVLIFSVSSEETGNYRKLSEKKFSVLLVKRNTYPFKDKWCLPGGFLKV